MSTMYTPSVGRGMSQSFGKYLRRLRKKKKLGIRTLAVRLRVSHTYLSHIENGRSLPGPGLVARMARVLRANKEELLIEAGHLPDDVARILRTHGRQAVEILRTTLGRKRRRSTSESL